MLRAVDRDDDFVQTPFIRGRRWFATDALGEVAPEPIDPEPDLLTPDEDPTLCEQIFDICRAQREAMIRPDGIGNDLTREAEAFKAWHRSWYFHTDRLSANIGLISLAMPYKQKCRESALRLRAQSVSSETLTRSMTIEEVNLLTLDSSKKYSCVKAS